MTHQQRLADYCSLTASHCFLAFYRSEPSGNCLYSSVLTSMELYLNANFYCKHPVILSQFDKYGDQICSRFNNLLPLCVSFESVDSDACGDQLVEMEAISNCENKKWSSFLCMLGLASVTKRKMVSYYPDCGENRFQLLFNCLIEPRPPLKPCCDDLHVLFCFDGEIKSGETFKPNGNGDRKL